MVDSGAAKNDAAERRNLMLELWGETLEVFRARLKSDKKGQLSASYMQTITAFLAQSGISAETAEEAEAAVDDLAQAALIRDIAAATEAVEPAPRAATSAPAEPTGAPLDRPFAPRPPTRA